jgi:serine/threonine-protein kinase HipA
MRKAKVFVRGLSAGILEETELKNHYRFMYNEGYTGDPVSLTMPLNQRVYEINSFPPFFDGLLPEGVMLEGLLKQNKIDKNDYFSQLIAVGTDMVGAVTVEEIK